MYTHCDVLIFQPSACLTSQQTIHCIVLLHVFVVITQPMSRVSVGMHLYVCFCVFVGVNCCKCVLQGLCSITCLTVPSSARARRYCGRCVLKMDHHCPWVNNCIGYNNYKFFMLFCSYATITSFYVAVVIFSGFVATIVERRPIQFTIVEFEYVVVFCLMMGLSLLNPKP